MEAGSTIYIRDDLLDRLMKAVDILNMKRSRLNEALLIMFMDRNMGKERLFEMQRYQKIDEDIGRGRICVFWRKDVYERGFDVRKSFKMSISFVIAEAIERYLDDLVKEILSINEPYNCPALYSIFTTFYSNVYIFATIWGDPCPEIFKKMQEICP